MKRNAIFDLAKKKAAELIDKWCEAFPNKGFFKFKTRNNDDMRGIICSGNDCNIVTVVISKAPDLEYVYMTQNYFENPTLYSKEVAGEKDRFYLEVRSYNEQRPLLAVRSKSNDSDEWSVGFFVFPEDEDENCTTSSVSEIEIGSYPGWFIGREWLRDGSFKDMAWVEIEAVTAEKFRSLLLKEVKSLEKDLLDKEKEYFLDKTFEGRLRDHFWEELKKKR